MTQTNPNTELPLHLRLPAFRPDYETGRFANTQTGEVEETITGVVLAYREDRVLWPHEADPNRTPRCVNGSEYGPCETCGFAPWGRDGTPPLCSAELTILVRCGLGVATVTARRSMIRPVAEYIAMHELLGDGLYSQRVTLSLEAVGGPNSLHVLRLMPGEYLESAELERERQVSTQVIAAFTAGALE